MTYCNHCPASFLDNTKFDKRCVHYERVGNLPEITSVTVPELDHDVQIARKRENVSLHPKSWRCIKGHAISCTWSTPFQSPAGEFDPW